MKSKWRWIYALPFIFLAHPFLYFVTYKLGRLAFEWSTGIPIDQNKTYSGILLGILVSVIPHVLISWFISTKPEYRYQMIPISIQMTVGTFMLDKLFPLLLAVYVFNETGSDAFYMLAEEFPYFAFKSYYLVWSVPLALAPYFFFLKRKRQTVNHVEG